MSKFGVPGESCSVIGGVPMTNQVKRSFAHLTASFLGMGRERGDLRGLSREEINMLEKSVQADMQGFCNNCQQQYNSDCQICNGTGSF